MYFPIKNEKSREKSTYRYLQFITQKYSVTLFSCKILECIFRQCKRKNSYLIGNKSVWGKESFSSEKCIIDFLRDFPSFWVLFKEGLQKVCGKFLCLIQITTLIKSDQLCRKKRYFSTSSKGIQTFEKKRIVNELFNKKLETFWLERLDVFIICFYKISPIN